MTQTHSTLGRKDRERLARLLAMTGSAHDGEALNAARLADRFVREHGFTWQTVLESRPPATLPRDPYKQILSEWPARWRQAVAVCMEAASYGMLAEKDVAFVRCVSEYEQMLSAKQLSWLRGIVVRLQARAS